MLGKEDNTVLLSSINRTCLVKKVIDLEKMNSKKSLKISNG
jgi:hypothetical protein